MSQQNAEQKIDKICRHDPRYPKEAYYFIANAVGFTTAKLVKSRHVSAIELLQGVRDYAQHEFGAVANMVLNDWGISQACDVGNIVYALIHAELLCASKDDSQESFNIDFALFEEEKEPTNITRAGLPKID